MKLSIILTFCLSVLFFCISSSAADSNENYVAKINNSVITEKTFVTYGEKRLGAPPGKNFPVEKRKELITELVNRELIYLDAVNTGLDKNELVVEQIQEQIRNILTRIRINKLLSDNPPSQEVLQAIYRSQIVDPASKEFHARHILLDDGDKANKVIEMLNAGGNFENLAKEHSTGPSANEGGDLGWFSPNQMVKPFSDAVAKLKHGDYSKRPVKTRFGWHVIKLENSRQVDPPPFESVEAQIMKIAQNKIINDFIQGLRKSATIEIK